jgi:hypothetical protein
MICAGMQLITSEANTPALREPLYSNVSRPVSSVAETPNQAGT